MCVCILCSLFLLLFVFCFVQKKGGAFSKKGGANSNQANLGPPEDSSRRLLLLEEATLAWIFFTELIFLSNFERERSA